VFHRAENVSAQGGLPVNLRCPACGQLGSFGLAGTGLLVSPAAVFAAAYICPNTNCQVLVHVITDPTTGRVLVTYPAELIDFDATNIPTEVKEALEEAIQCHAQECYTAAAIMVRKTLEELCRERKATGKDLKARIADLGSKVVLPQELLDGLDDLRLLGNDAAHIESRVFNDIGKDEVEVGVEFAKEVLKAVYQYSDLLARLRALKTTT
jgi:Domain of unknown function (DUF4145)